MLNFTNAFSSMRSFCQSIACLSTCLFAALVSAEEVADAWKYTLRKPVEGWRAAKFDDSEWTVGNGGFGTTSTPGSRVGTIWATDNIWLRKTFELKSIPANPVLWMHHDEDAEVFINGKPVATVKGFSNKYGPVPIPAEKRSAIMVGKNVMAVHCKQTTGGQFIDVHLIDGENAPKLPTPTRDTKPFQSELITFLQVAASSHPFVLKSAELASGAAVPSISG